MNDAVRKALQEYASDVIDDARYYMDADDINASGTLSKNLRYWIRETRDGIVITWGARPPADKYARWAEEGRNAGTRPPVAAIAKWIMVKQSFRLRDRKGRFTKKTMKKAMQAAFPIARAIGRRGTKPKQDGSRGGQMLAKAARDNRRGLDSITKAFGAQVRDIMRTPKPYTR